MICVTKRIDSRGQDSKLICADIAVEVFSTSKKLVRDRLDWPPCLTACPRLTEIEEDVFESFKDDEREVPGVIRHRFKR